jgi:chorismate synthase
MSANSFGRIFCLNTFGESHGPAIGGSIDGCPAGLHIDLDFIQAEMRRRRPGQSSLTTQRTEEDEVEFLSGIFEGKTTGAPIGFIIRNKDNRSKDYEALRKVYRPSHADFTYDQKYGFRDYRGGGRSSARETACRVAAGAVAKLLLRQWNITVQAFVKQIGTTVVEGNYNALDLTKIEESPVRCPSPAHSLQMVKEIEDAKAAGDSLGGVIQCVALNVPAGLGEPVFDKFYAVMAHAMMSINAVKGFETGSGFEGVRERGSVQNDGFIRTEDGHISTTGNNSGGVQGGITNGQPLFFNLAFKPVASISATQKTVDTAGIPQELKIEGRHDPCVRPRAVPIVESMAALVLADFLLLSRSSKMPETE